MTKNKIILMVVAISATLLPPQTASAVGEKTLVIIDSGINTDLAWAKSAVIDEACFVEFNRCPNGFSQMTGAGASKITPAMTTAGSFSHGTQMASVAVAVDPNVKIVSIRVAGMTAKGVPNPYTAKAISWALDYVEANKARLNVGAVSISLGNSYKSTECPIVGNLQTQITNLMASGVAVAIAVGNGGSTKIDYPACIPEVIAVGATETPYAMKGVVGWVNPVMSISNGGSDLDLYTLGKFVSSDISGVESLTLGSSNATVAFATRLTSLLSSGKGLIAVMTDVQATYTKAYRSLKDFTTNYYSLDR